MLLLSGGKIMRKWKYKLEDEGKQLRKLINEGELTLETVISVYKQMIVCLKLLKTKLIGIDRSNLEYEIDSMIEDYQIACPEEADTKIYDYYEEEDNLNFNLREFYDFCDYNRVWIGLEI